MKSTIFLTHTLTFLAISLLSVNGQSKCCPVENCCSDSCQAPNPYNITLNELVSLQPYYVEFYPIDPENVGLDNVCYTFSTLPDETYLYCVNRVYVLPSYNTTQCYTLTMNEPGIFTAGSAICTEQITIFDYIDTEDCVIFLVYVCFKYGDCTFQSDEGIPLYGFTTKSTRISDACLARAIDTISRDGQPSQSYFALPMNLPTGCVNNVCY